MLLPIVVVVLATSYAFLWYFVKKTVWCTSQASLVGKTAIITGANTGIGYETALDFAKRGARVILACRNEAKALIARQCIIDETGNENIVFKKLDLASLESVKQFANEINETEEHLHILVNNAGAAGLSDKTTGDGLNLPMQINYFSSFLLTNLLLKLLKKSAPSRIINVSSVLAKHSKLDVDDLNKYTNHYDNYANAKLCNILFTMQLAAKLKDTKVVAYSVHPGAVKTAIFRRAQGFHKIIIDFLKEHFFKTPEEGAQTTIFVSIAPNLEEITGQHFENCEFVDRYEPAKVPGLAEKVWENTETLLGLK